MGVNKGVKQDGGFKLRKAIHEKRILLTICSGILLILCVAFYMKAADCYSASSDCQWLANEFCDQVCWNHGDCDRAEFVDGYCIMGTCNQLFDIYCNDGYWGEHWEYGCNA